MNIRLRLFKKMRIKKQKLDFIISRLYITEPFLVAGILAISEIVCYTRKIIG